jgi:hypothetical protein
MRIGVVVLLCLGTSAFARLGDTQDQAEARYGLPKKLFAFDRPLIEGARDLMFHYEGWRSAVRFSRRPTAANTWCGKNTARSGTRK